MATSSRWTFLDIDFCHFGQTSTNSCDVTAKTDQYLPALGENRTSQKGISVIAWTTAVRKEGTGEYSRFVRSGQDIGRSPAQINSDPPPCEALGCSGGDELAQGLAAPLICQTTSVPAPHDDRSVVSEVISRQMKNDGIIHAVYLEMCCLVTLQVLRNLQLLSTGRDQVPPQIATRLALA
ncbi:hypothetical protein Clacol_008482 [Clathrus columnatus]|uniref:Uncharacterized protein n=1 Tax=Clathrus columnatus TaxID=1419009 RepID=A0AAV5AIP5_9AGAM|nr:hypothetical protein Clacol_008482 [Clathrus columnatus]